MWKRHIQPGEKIDLMLAATEWRRVIDNRAMNRFRACTVASLVWLAACIVNPSDPALAQAVAESPYRDDPAIIGLLSELKDGASALLPPVL